MRHPAWLCVALALFSSPALADDPPPPPDRVSDESESVPDPDPAKPAEPVIVPPKVIDLPQAVYPPEALEQGIEADVVFLLTVTLEGTAADVVVDKPAGQGFDEAARAAVEGMRFEPATVDGVPTPVRITYTYRFTIEKKEVVEAPDPDPEPEPEPEPDIDLPVVIEGDLVERGTRKSVVGAAIIVVETGETVLTDEEGRFRVRGKAPGALTLEVPLEGYEPLTRKVSFSEAKVAKVRLRLTKNSYLPYGTVVKRPPKRKEVSKKTLTVVEIQKVPGNSGDALKVIQTLPGVARSSFNNGQLIVRGSSPEDTKVYLQKQLLPQLYHFGGIYSVINTDLLEGLDFWPGGFAPAYGNALGGLVNVRLRPPKNDRWHFTIESNFIHTGILAEGPVSDDVSIAIAARRSYIDLLLPLVVSEDDLDFVVAPRYYDYQFRLFANLHGAGELDVSILGTDDELSFVLDEPAGPSGAFRDNLSAAFDFHQIIATHRVPLSQDLRLETSLRFGTNAFSFSAGAAAYFDLRSYPLIGRTELEWDVAPALTLGVGFEGGWTPFVLDICLPPPPKEGNPGEVPKQSDFICTRADDEAFVLAAPYVEGVFRIGEQLTINPGLRLTAIYQGESEAVVPDPRLAIRWQLSEETALKAFTGMYHQAPQGDEWDEDFGNPALGAERAIQVSLGYEQEITEVLNLDLQLFYKWLDNLVVPVDPTVRGVRLTNEGVGRVYGAELLLKHEMSDRFFGWLAYTLLKAERRDQPGGQWRPFDFDQTHIMSVLGVFRLGSGWEAGFRFRYVTGNPTTPIVGAVYNSDTDTYAPTYGPTNSARQRDFHQLDLRVDKKWVFDTWMLALYIEIQNVYLSENQEGVSYNYDYTESQATTGIPILPTFGIRADF